MEALVATVNYNELSMIKRIAVEFLDNLKARVISNDCNDEDIMQAMAKYHPSVNKEYFNPNDYCNYDEALKILKLSNNRAKLKQLCDEYGIECVHIKNRPLGFPKKDIERLAEILSEDVKKREMKDKRKKGQRKLLW
jgi:vacuolar-type H+-ATPase subunit I/STV1